MLVLSLREKGMKQAVPATTLQAALGKMMVLRLTEQIQLREKAGQRRLVTEAVEMAEKEAATVPLTAGICL